MSNFVVYTVCLTVALVACYQLAECRSTAPIPHAGTQSNFGNDNIQYYVPYRRGDVNGANYQATAENLNAPVYVSPYSRSDVMGAKIYKAPEELSGDVASSNYAPDTVQAAPSRTRDLKAAASYGHNHHGGYDHGGWLDMGAWTGGKGSFGWYADYPVGKHGYGK